MDHEDALARKGKPSEWRQQQQQSRHHDSDQEILHVPIKDHVMGASLSEYVASKVHNSIIRDQPEHVSIRGFHVRDPPAIISTSEKIGKGFNYQRPTIRLMDDSSMQLDCFPGKDYVQHYLALVTSYYNITNQVLPAIQYSIPSHNEGMSIYLKSNLASMGPVDTVIIGYVQHFEHLANGTWQSGSGDGVKLFAWMMLHESQDQRIALLGCMTSFWGDLAGQLIRALQQLNSVKCVLYIGKTGTLSPEYKPNQLIATGNSSFLGDELITWSNPFQSYMGLSSRIREGNHVTVVSPLIESKAWLGDWQPKCSWVDCEVGHMARASNQGNTKFGYLHVVSDNIATKFPYDLTNERAEVVLQDRSICFAEVEIVLRALLAIPRIANVRALSESDDIAAEQSQDNRLNHRSPSSLS